MEITGYILGYAIFIIMILAFMRGAKSGGKDGCISEGTIKKGGVNNRPTTERPPPPKGQGLTYNGVNFYLGEPIEGSGKIVNEDIGKTREECEKNDN